MHRLLINCLLAVLLAGCGVAYISPRITDAAAQVDIIQLTPETVRLANQDDYTPRPIPAVFFQNAGTPQPDRSLPTTPATSINAQIRPEPLATRPPPEVAQTPYQIGIGDVVLLSTRSTGNTVEELSGLLAAQNSRQGYTVQDDGAIAVPEVGRIRLNGLTLEQAEATLFQSLIARQIDPTFSLEIAEFNSKRVTLGGAVARPLIVPITLTPLLLNEAIAQAGGIMPKEPEYTSIRIYRDSTLYQVPLDAYLRDPALQKIRLVAGDTVFVDTSYDLEQARTYFTEQITLLQLGQQNRIEALNALTTEVTLHRAALTDNRVRFQERIALDAVARDYVYLTGEFSNPRRFTLPFGRRASLADALYDQGGFANETGNPGQIYLLRRTVGQQDAVTAWHLNTGNVSNMMIATRFLLRPDDIVFIAEQPITRWNRAIQQLVPSLITTGIGVATNG